MIRLSSPRLLPVTILATAVVLVIKAQSLTRVAMADDPPSRTSEPLRSSQAISSEHVPDIRPAGSSSRKVELVPVAELAANSEHSGLGMPPDWSLLQDLRARREELDRRARELDLRESVLQAEKVSVTHELEKLRQSREELQKLELARQQRRDGDRLATVKLYEAMKPDEAAAIFNTLDQHLLVQLLDRMNERKAAAIMGSMEPDRARTATQALAVYRLKRDEDPAADTGSPGLAQPSDAR